MKRVSRDSESNKPKLICSLFFETLQIASVYLTLLENSPSNITKFLLLHFTSKLLLLMFIDKSVDLLTKSGSKMVISKVMK